MEIQEIFEQVASLKLPERVSLDRLPQSLREPLEPLVSAVNDLRDVIERAQDALGSIEWKSEADEDGGSALKGDGNILVHESPAGTTIHEASKLDQPVPKLPWIFLREGAYYLATDGVNNGDPRTRLTGVTGTGYGASALVDGRSSLDFTHRMRRTLVDGREAYEDASSIVRVEWYVNFGNVAYRVYCIVTGTPATNP